MNNLDNNNIRYLYYLKNQMFNYKTRITYLFIQILIILIAYIIGLSTSGLVFASTGIVIPAYRPDIPVLKEYVKQIDKKINPEVIVIELDGFDECPAQIDNAPATVNVVSERRGKGSAITSGFEKLNTDTLAFADADGSTPPSELYNIISTLEKNKWDLVVGSRRHQKSTITSQSPARQQLGDGFAWIARRLHPITLYDYQCGAKAINLSSWKKVRPYLSRSGFAWDIELLAFAQALNLDITEIPIEWHDHPGSTVNPISTSIKLAYCLIESRVRSDKIQEKKYAIYLDRLFKKQKGLIEGDIYKNNE